MGTSRCACRAWRVVVMAGWGQQQHVNLGAELRTWRDRRGLSLRALGKRAKVHHTLIYKVEKGQASLTLQVARACDAALDAGGALVTSWHAARDTIRPAQLPISHPHLAGRASEIAAMDAAVATPPGNSPPVLAIDGPAGVGKTALALLWAHRATEQYVDGQLYADMRGFTPGAHPVTAEAVLEEFLGALGAASIPDGLAQRASLFRSMLAGRRVLIVLDNVRNVEDVTPLLPATPECAVVVTSRRTLAALVGGLGARRIPLSVLDETAAVEMLCHIIRDDRARPEAETLTQLAHMCGRLPRALRAIAEHLMVHPHRTVAGLAAELRASGEARAVLEMAELESDISCSYTVLDEDSANVLQMMGLHPQAHQHVDAVAALTGHTRSRTVRALHRLASVHLVQLGANDTVHLHDMIRAFVQNLQSARGKEPEHAAAIRRLATWYVKTAWKAVALIHPDSELPPTPDLAESVDPLSFANREEAKTWFEAEGGNIQLIVSAAGHRALSESVRLLTRELEAHQSLEDTTVPSPRVHTPGQRSSRVVDPQGQPGIRAGDEWRTLPLQVTGGVEGVAGRHCREVTSGDAQVLCDHFSRFGCCQGTDDGVSPTRSLTL